MFDYLKWRAERKDKEVKDDIGAEISKLIGEINGLERKIDTYRAAASRLMFSPHLDIAEFEDKVEKKRARIEYLKKKEQQ